MYESEIKKFCSSSGRDVTAEFKPFLRQVDFWYLAFLIAVKKDLSPDPSDDTYKITPASILSTDPHRITYMQGIFLGKVGDVERLAQPKEVFDFCSNLANAGIPVLLQILNDSDQRPLWNGLDAIEEMLSE
jgi:hypothetical protein